MRALKACLVSLVMLVSTRTLFAACSWTTPPSTIAFGAYSVFSTTDENTSSQFTFKCKKKDYAQITISTGSSGVFVPSRTVRNGPNSGNYNIYLDAGGSMIWGDSTGGNTYDFLDETGDKNYAGTMFGIMPAGQDLATGTYTDTVFVTLSHSKNAGGPWTNLPPVSVTVSVTVSSECRVDTFSLTFGLYSPLSGAPVNQNSVVNVYCTRTAPATFALDDGANPSGLQKRMASGANRLNYTATLASGAGVSASSLTPIGNGIVLNGSIPPSQDVPIGSYIDTLQVAVDY